jgi:hypothetical protein
VSRLVNFGLGEICDRISILALKLLHAEEKKIDVSHFRNERATLMTKVLARDGGRWIEYFTDLAAVNAALWSAEDALRELRSADLANENAARTAFRIQALNDKRAELITQINSFSGEKTQEKV